MPGWSSKPAPAARAVPLIASAVLVSRKSLSRITGTTGWQEDAWRYYQDVPEVKAGVRWLANSCSRARLYIGRVDPNGDADPYPVQDERLQRLMQDFAGGPEHQSQLIARMTKHLAVPGEDYLIAWDDQVTRQRRWLAASTDELKKKNGILELTLPDGERQAIDPATDFVCHVWRPNDRRAWEPDSPMRSLLRPLRTLCALDMHVDATIDSRLSGPGILPIPESATIASATPKGDAESVHDDAFMDALTRAMVTPIQDRDSASAVVPIVIRVPDEVIGKIGRVDFQSSFDAQVPGLIEGVRHRVALGLDVPPEVLDGMGDVNHWTGWLISEEGVKTRIRPALDLILGPLTQRWLRPTLAAMGISDQDLVVAADTTGLTQRADRTGDCILLFDRGLVGGDTVRREVGFGDEDKPTPAELEQQIRFNLAKTPQGMEVLRGGQISETTTAPAVKQGVKPAELPAAGVKALPGTREDSPPAAGPRTVPRPAGPVQADAMVAAAEQAVLRALELAGRRAMGRIPRYRVAGIKPWNVHTRVKVVPDDCDRLLAGAWDMLAATRTPAPVVAALDAYTRRLLTTATVHARPMLSDALRSWT